MIVVGEKLLQQQVNLLQVSEEIKSLLGLFFFFFTIAAASLIIEAPL